MPVGSFYSPACTIIDMTKTSPNSLISEQEKYHSCTIIISWIWIIENPVEYHCLLCSRLTKWHGSE